MNSANGANVLVHRLSEIVLKIFSCFSTKVTFIIRTDKTRVRHDKRK